MDNQRIYGNVFRLLDAAMAFLFKHLSLTGRIERLEREEQLSIPYKAVREGVLDALTHRSYREIRLIFRYNNRLANTSPESDKYRPSTDQVPTKHRPSECLDKDTGKQ